MFKLPPLKSLIIFDAVARLLHFARAADELNITPSAVSQQIKILETYLGCFLIKRDNKSVSLTPQGKEFHTQIHKALNIIATATEAIKPTKSNLVHLEIVTTLAMQWLIPNLPNLQLAYPEIELIISTNLHAQSQHSHMIPDISITSEVYNPNSANDLLWLDDLVLITPPAIKEKTVESTIQKYTAISVTHPLRTSDWQIFCQHHQLPPPKNTLVVSNTLQAIEAVKNHVGIFVTHLPLIYQDLEKQSIKIIGDAVKTGNAFYLHYTPQQIPSTNARNVRDWLLKLIKLPKK